MLMLLSRLIWSKKIFCFIIKGTLTTARDQIMLPLTAAMRFCSVLHAVTTHKLQFSAKQRGESRFRNMPRLAVMNTSIRLYYCHANK